MKRLLCVALCLTLLLSCLPMVGMAETKALVNFIDLNGHWAKSYVVPLAEEGIIKGKTANRFDPDGQITRAEFLTLALKVANLPVEIYKESYADVDESQWFAKVAHTAQKADILAPEMVVDNRLLPDAPILREEMTAVIMRLIGVMRGTTVDSAHSFTDTATFAPWANEYIGKAAKLGIVTGNPDGSFNAKGSATRGEAAVMFSRLKKFLEETPLFTPAGEYSPVYDAIVYEGVDINKMINDAYAAGEKEVTIAPGAYRIKSTPKGGHIRLENMKDFTINGEGVILLLQTQSANGFYMSDCENVTLDGFTLDWEKGAIMQGQIYNVDPDGYYFDITVEPGYPHDFESGKMDVSMQTAYFDGETGLLKEMDSHLVAPSSYEKLGPNTYRLNSARSVSASGNATVGDYIAAPAYLTSCAIYMSGCKNNTVKNFTSWSSYSSFNDLYGEGGTHYDNVRITRGPKPLGAISPRMVGSHGDGIHALVLRKGPLVTNCTFEHMLDDGIAIGNYRAYVVGQEG
ncbi:MAG: S-layer homology domain-containing protein, partial [Clostridia bacterium]|nr:S-layer homology domain-containing protein [Clostridia bacterium]